MERNANYAMVGIAALILFAGLAVFVIWLAQLRFASDFDNYDVVFQGPVRGISQGGEVHFNGIKVGEITNIALDPTNSTRVIARIKVTSDVPIRVDSFATLEPQGITGVNYIQISAGTNSRPLLKDQTPRGEVPVIRSQRSALADLLEGGGTVLQRTVEALDRLNRLFSDKNIAAASATMENVRSLTAEIEARKAVMADLQTAVRSIDETARSITALSNASRGLVDGEGRQALASLNETAEELQAAARDVRGVVTRLEGPTSEFASTGLPQLTGAIVSMQTAAESLNRVLNEAQQSPGSLISKPAAKEIEVQP